MPSPKARQTRHIGRPLKRVEDPRLIQGLGTYVDDVRLADMAHAVFLRSPYAHAKITRINADAARAVPGVLGVFTGADVNAHCGLIPCSSAMADQKMPRHTVLAGDRVYFVGHPLVVVVARERSIGRDSVD